MQKVLEKILWWVVVSVGWPLFALVFVTDPHLNPELVGRDRWDGAGVVAIATMFVGWVLLLAVSVALIMVGQGVWWVVVVSAASLHLVMGLTFTYITIRPKFVAMMGFKSPVKAAA